jgi:uncharacterized membrane protein
VTFVQKKRMTSFFQAILALHITAGFLALGAGSLIAAGKKGTRRHRQLGRVFYYAMLLIALSAMALAARKSNDFLLFLAMFALFQSLGGRRVIRNTTGQIKAVDYLILVFGVGNSFLMILSLNPLLLFFGALSLLAAAGFARYCFARRGGGYDAIKRLGLHINLMGGSFIATLTAFVVVNVPRSAYELVPGWLPWVMPTLLFTPVMVRWMRKYTRKGLRTV